MIRKLVLLTTKMLQKPLFLPFQAPKRVWEALSQIFGKSQIFLGHLDHKKVPKMQLLFRAGIKSPKKAKKRIFRSEFQSCPQQNAIETPFLPFQAPKRIQEGSQKVSGKSQIFRLNMITKRGKNSNFCSVRGL